MAGECKMNQDELISELLQALTNDVQRLQKQVAKLPTQPPADYRASIEKLAQAVQELRQTPKPVAAAAAVDLSAITAQLTRMENQIRQRPEFKMTLYTQIAAVAFGLMVAGLVAMTWFGLNWKEDRDSYQQAYWEADWRVRYIKQARPEFYNYMQARFAKEPAAVNRWIEEQEQIDATKAAAQKASEQAKALADQAKRLEDGATTKGAKPGGR